MAQKVHGRVPDIISPNARGVLGLVPCPRPLIFRVAPNLGLWNYIHIFIFYFVIFFNILSNFNIFLQKNYFLF
jgi:hypothetical protein